MPGARVVSESSFIKNLVRVPASLYVVPKLRSRLDEHHFQIAKASLERHGTDAIRLLRHLRLSGKVLPTTLPPDIEDQKAFGLLGKLTADGLTEQDDIHGKVTWRINPVMQSVLEELLYQSNSGAQP